MLRPNPPLTCPTPVVGCQPSLLLTSVPVAIGEFLSRTHYHSKLCYKPAGIATPLGEPINPLQNLPLDPVLSCSDGYCGPAWSGPLPALTLAGGYYVLTL